MSRAAAKKAAKKGLSNEEKVILVEKWMATHPQPYTLKELQQRIPKQTPVVYQSVEECVKLLVAEGRIEEDRVGVSTLLWKFPPTAAQLENRSSGQPGRNGGLGSSLASSAAVSGCPVSYTELLQRLTASGSVAQRHQQQQVSVESMKRWCASTPDAQLREWRDMLQAENNRAIASLSAEWERLDLHSSGSGEHDDVDTPAGGAVVLAELAHLQELALQRAQLLAEHKKLSSRQVMPDLLDQLDRASSIALEAANRWTDNYYLAEEEVVGKLGFGGSRRDVRAALQLPLELTYLSDESDAESDLGGYRRQEGVDGCNSAHLPCGQAHDAALPSPLPPHQGNPLGNAGGPPSTQDTHPILAVSPGDDAFPAAQADVRATVSTPAAAAAAATLVAHADTTGPRLTSAKAKSSKAAKRARSRKAAEDPHVRSIIPAFLPVDYAFLSRKMPLSSSLELPAALQQRILAASSVLRLTPDAFLARLLSQYYNTLGGLPRHLLRYILTFLDYSTISAILTRVCRLWQECVIEDPLQFFARLRQTHGIHLLDPVHGLFYFPRALKRVVIESKAGASAHPSAVTTAAAPSGAGGTHQGFIPVTSIRANAVSRVARQHDTSSPQVVPATSFLTVDIRTQNTKSLPWDYVQETVQWAIARERMIYGEVRSPNLQQSEGAVWSQAATVAYDRRIYMFGGETYEGVVLDRAYEYDPITRHWGVLPALSEKRAAATAVAYRGHIFVFGGYNAEGSVLDTYEVLAVETRLWISQTHSPQCFYKRQRTRTQGDAAASPETVPQYKSVVREDSHGHTPRVPGAAVAGSIWPFSEGPPPGWTVAGRRSSVSSLYRMPEKVCGTAVAVHGNVFLFAGGYQSCIAPEQTAVIYSAVSSTTTTPMHAVPGGVGGGPSSDITSSTTSTSAANTPQRLPRVGSVSTAGQATAESFVWVFCPRTGRWWTRGPRLPSPRAFGAAAVLELPILGPCLCYFGGCAKADAPETAMFYIPLCAATETRALAGSVVKDCADGDTKRTPGASSPSNVAEEGAMKSRPDGTGGEVSDAATPPGATAATAVAGAPPRRASATLTRAETRGGAAPRREEAGVRGTTHRGYRGAQAAPVATLDRDVVAHTDPSRPEQCATEAGSSVTASGSRGSAICSRRTPNELRRLTPTTFAPHRRLQRSGVESVRDISRPTASADDGDAFGSGGNDDGAFLPDGEADTAMIWRCFRNPIELPWQRYVRIPIGGAFTSVVVLGAQHSRSLVLTGFYPTPNIGFCKVDHLLPLDAFVPLLGALSLPLPERGYAESLPSTGQETEAVRARRKTTTPPKSPPPPVAGSAPGAARAAAPASGCPTLELSPNLHDEAAMAVNHWHQEREWNHHQRQEIREMVRSAAHAATMRHPRIPQTAGEEHNWSLAPVPEVRVVSRSGPSPLRVSWKVQTLNAKVIVGIE